MTETFSFPAILGRRAVALVAVALAFLVPPAVASAANGATPSHARLATSSASVVPMTNALVAHWAPVVGDVGARRAPSRGAPVVAPVVTITSEGTQNIVLILARTIAGGQTWYDVRLATLPNSLTGWVPASALGTVYAVTTRVGVGKSYWPTPRGQFYIRDKLTDFNNPFYGPVAFGTSARSDVLTDWPGGGFVGVH